MTVYSYWEEGKRVMLAARAQACITDWKNQKYICEECKEQLTAIKDCSKTNEQGTTYYVVPHFSHKPESTCSKAKGESEEHLSRKIRILSALYTGKTKINVSGTSLLLNPINIKGEEIIRKENRADILIEFNSFNPIFGAGIVIEIMETETNESIEKKTEEWLAKGYSLISVPAWADIDKVIQHGLDLESVFTKKLLDSLSSKEKLLKDLLLRAEVQPALQQMSITVGSNSCANCFYGSQDKDIHGNFVPDSFCCWIWQRKGYQKRPDKYDRQAICNFWRSKV